MPTAQIVVGSIVQDSQSYNSFDKNDEHVVTVISFSMTIGDAEHPDMKVEVRQPYGTNYETEPLEMARPTGSYAGNWPYNEFREVCEAVYREALARAITITMVGGNMMVRMRNNTFNFGRRLSRSRFLKLGPARGNTMSQR